MAFYKMAIADLANFTFGFPFGLKFPIPENKDFTEEKDKFTLIRLLYLLNRMPVLRFQGMPAHFVLIAAEKYFNEIQSYKLDRNLKRRLIRTGILCRSDFDVLKSDFFLKDYDFIPLKKFDPGLESSDIPERCASDSNLDLLPYVPPKGEEFRTRRYKVEELNIRKIAKDVKTENKEVIFIKEFQRDDADTARSVEEFFAEFSTPKGKELGAAKGEELSARKAKEIVIIKPFQGADFSAPTSEDSCLTLLTFEGNELVGPLPRDDEEIQNDYLFLDPSIIEDMHNTTSEESDSRKGRELDPVRGKSSITADEEEYFYNNVIIYEDRPEDYACHFRGNQFPSLEAFLNDGFITTADGSSQSKLTDTPQSDDKSDTTHEEEKEFITIKAFKGDDDDDELGASQSDEFINLEGFFDNALGALKSKECVNLDEFHDDDDDNELETSSSQGGGDELDTTVKNDDEDMDVTIKAEEGELLDTIPEGDQE